MSRRIVAFISTFFLVAGTAATLAQTPEPHMALPGSPEDAKIKAMGRATGCKSNLLNISRALQAYADDHKGKYPVSLSGLAPRYLKRLPCCPTFADFLEGPTHYEYQHHSRPTETYVLSCKGGDHSPVGIPASYPQYTNDRGLLLKP